MDYLTNGDCQGDFFPIALAVSIYPLFLAETIMVSGIPTRKYFNRIRDHIKQNNGQLKQKFVERLIISKTENRSLIGYCQLQGIYLAACWYGQEDVFRETKKNVSNNRIPNF